MAEGGFSSVKDGTDADFDIVCTPCCNSSIRQEAVTYCHECQEHLCTTCTKHHGRQRTTRSHKLQASSTVKMGSMVRHIEMYCGTHDMVCCTKCYANEHWTCHGVIDAEDVKPSASIKSEIQVLQTDIKNFQDRVVQIDKKTQNNIVTLEIADEIKDVDENTESEQRIAQKLYKVKSKKDVNIKMNNDKETCFFTDICQLPDGTIILTDGSNKKIKRLDMNYNIKDHCDLDGHPSGICCTGQNEVAVKISNHTVQFVSVESSLSKLRQIFIEDGGCWGMVYCAGELWISTEDGVDVYDTSGTFLKNISKDTNGQNIFKSCIQHMAVSGETVIVTDDSNGAVCLGMDGTVIREFRDDRLANTKGVCVTADGTVFLGGSRSINIVMFDKNGKCLGELVYLLPAYPMALYSDDKRDCLTVTFRNSDIIHIYDISR